jgi:hypothetical protein
VANYIGHLSQQADVQKLMDRFMKFVSFEPMSGCWLWIGHTMKNGYGKFGHSKKHRSMLAHRESYMLFNGDLVDGLDVDHVCCNRSCVNPEHLVLATRSQNIMRYRRNTPIDPRRYKTHCKHGHEFTSSNTYIKPNGCRACRQCLSLRSMVSFRKKNPKKNVEVG